MVNAKICKLRFVMLITVFTEKNSSNETKSQESYFSGQDTLTNLKESQQYIISFDKSLKTIWPSRDTKPRQRVLLV